MRSLLHSRPTHQMKGLFDDDQDHNQTDTTAKQASERACCCRDAHPC